MIPFSFWFLLAMCIAAVAVGIITMKKFPDIPSDDVPDTINAWKKKAKEWRK